LTRAGNWQKTCGAADGNVDNLRSARFCATLNGKLADMADAADSLISDVMDRYFAHGKNPVFEDIAADLSFATLEREEEEDDGLDRATLVRNLYVEVCRQPDLKGDPNFQGRGWTVIEPTHETSLKKAVLAAGGTGSLTERSFWQPLTAEDWPRILGVPGARLDFRIRGRRVGVRFLNGPPKRAETLFNGELAPHLLSEEPADREDDGSDLLPFEKPAPVEAPPPADHGSAVEAAFSDWGWADDLAKVLAGYQVAAAK
jgi:hypothetical protein